MKRETFGSVRAGLWGVAAGLAFGVGLGIILAPEEGAVTRRRIAFRLDNLAQRLGDGLNALLKDDAVSEAHRSADAVVADARDRAHRIRQDIDHLMDEMRKMDTARGKKSE